MSFVISFVVIAGISFTAQTFYNLKKESRLTRIKTAMILIHDQVKTLANMPQGYSNCSVITNCTVNSLLFDRYKRVPLPGTPCIDGSSVCGISLTWNDTAPSNLKKFQGQITYEGNDFTINPLLIDTSIPIDVLQASIISCNGGYITGFNETTGQVTCHQPIMCGPGEYAKSIDATTYNASCSTWPSGTLTPYGKFWVNGYAITQIKVRSTGASLNPPCWWPH